MTDKEKLAKVRAEIERLKHQSAIDSDRQAERGLQSASIASFGKVKACEELLSFIDSMQKEPESHKPKITLGEATGKLKECIDNITDESLAKARKQLQEESKVCIYSTANFTNADRLTLCKDCKELCKYNQKTAAESLGISQEAYDEIVDKCLYGSEVELVDGGDLPKEEPKKCMYSKDNYTDEDRIVLCDGCEEECKYVSNIPPVFDEGYWERLGEKPVSEDLEQAIDTYLATYFGGEKEKQDWPFLKKMAIHFANWQKKKDDYAIEIAHMAGEEEGKNIMKQRLMANAVDAVVKIDAGGYPYVDRTIELYDYDKDIPLAKRGDKYKVILIKE